MGTIRKKERGQNFIAGSSGLRRTHSGVLEGTRRRALICQKAELAILRSAVSAGRSRLANAVRIGEAERLSQTDDLTKLHNARYLRQFLLNEIRRAAPLWFQRWRRCSLDLDDFKR